MSINKKHTLARIAPFLGPIVKAKDLTILGFIIAIIAITIAPLTTEVLDFFLTILFVTSVLHIFISFYIPKPQRLLKLI